MRSLSLARASGILLVGVFGCGLISSDITKVTFDLPTKHYTFSSQGFALPAGVPNMKITCGTGGQVPTCPSPLSCDAGVCSGHIPLSVYQTINLKNDVQALMGVSSQTLVDITLESMSYDVVNTANVPIPEIELYLAPANVTSASNPAAMKFGSVPAIPAGMNASGDVVKDPGADALFIMYGQNFGTPFNFIAATTVVVPTGTTPMGMVDVTINGKIAAKL